MYVTKTITVIFLFPDIYQNFSTTWEVVEISYEISERIFLSEKKRDKQKLLQYLEKTSLNIFFVLRNNRNIKEICLRLYFLF